MHTHSLLLLLSNQSTGSSTASPHHSKGLWLSWLIHCQRKSCTSTWWFSPKHTTSPCTVLPSASTQRHRTGESEKRCMRCRELLLNYGKRSIRYTNFPGCQETTYVIADLYLLLASLSIFILAHSLLKSFYQFVNTVSKVFEISHGFLNYFFRPHKHLPKGEYFFMLERYNLGQSKVSRYQTSHI